MFRNVSQSRAVIGPLAEVWNGVAMVIAVTVPSIDTLAGVLVEVRTMSA